jgi:hypothetical protein
MKAAAVATVALAAGTVGGIVGAFLAPSPAAAPAAGRPERAAPPDDSAAALRREFEELRGRVDVAETAAGKAASEAAALRKELEDARAALVRVEGRVNDAAAAAPIASEALSLSVAADRLRSLSLEGMPERMRRTTELRAKPLEERWTAIRDALGITIAQQDELVAALAERDEALRAALTGPRMAEGDGGTTAVRVDREKLAEVRKKYDDRVAQALSSEQLSRYRNDGYEDAVRGGTTLSGRTAVIFDGGPQPPAPPR